MSAPWKPGTELARGATSVVRRGVPGTVEKTLLPHIPPVLARMEAESARLAESAGLPVATLVDSRLDDSPPSLVFAHVDAVPLHEAPELDSEAIGHLLADLQFLIHQVETPATFLDAHAFLGRQLAGAPLGDAVRADIRADLDDLPRGSTLCHMDFHPLNVLWNGQPTIIDWSNAVASVPAADVARTRILLASAAAEREDADHMAAAIRAARDAFETRTEHLRPGLIGQSQRWDRVLAAARLDERPSDRESAVLWRVLEGDHRSLP